MFTLGKKQATKAAPKQKGDEFLENCRKTMWQVFTAYVDQAEQFNSVEDYSEALFSDLWQVTDKLLRSSYKNGAQSGRAQKRRSAG